MNNENPLLAGLQERGSVGYVYLVSCVAAVGGLLFGFDTAIISGAIVFVKEEFVLDDIEEGFAVSCLLIGCILGACFAGVLSDRIGRKKVLIGTAVFFAVSAILSALPHTLTWLVIARFLGGLAVGVSSMVSPLYIAEISPARIRGRLVALNQMTIVTGILLAYFVNAQLMDIGPNNWRWMFASESLPAMGLFVGLLFVPESPRWLMTQGHDHQALSILARVDGREHALLESVEIKTAIAEEQGSLAELLQPGLRIALIIGVVLAVLQQITGINTVVYYGPKIFQKAGYPETYAFWAQVLVGVTMFFFTIIALWTIDKIGRKALLLIGASGMSVCLALAGWKLPDMEASMAVKLIPILAYVAFFGVGLGPTVWVIIAEIFPTRVRGRAMAIATVSLWVACFAVSQTFPYLIERFGERFTFWMYAGICVVMILFVFLFVVETKGKTLEEIERMWRLRKSSMIEAR